MELAAGPQNVGTVELDDDGTVVALNTLRHLNNGFVFHFQLI